MKILTTVGTSLCTNLIKETRNETLSNSIASLENSVYSAQTLEVNKKKLNQLKNELKDFAKKEDASAEIKSCLKMKEILGDDIEVQLITTDTILSNLCAEVIKETLEDNGISVNFNPVNDRIEYLQVKDKAKFEKEGLTNLINYLNKISNNYYDDLSINITGGYKGVIPFLTLWAQINKIPIYYIFEESDELIRIPQTPIDIDFGLFEKFSAEFLELAGEVEESLESYVRRKNLPKEVKELITEVVIDNKSYLSLNSTGLIFWKKYSDFWIVEIPKGSKYFNEETNKKKMVNIAIKELIRRLNLISDFETLLDKDIKHTSIGNKSWVFKMSSPQQIRLNYIYQNRKLKILNYFFINSDKDDKKYSEWFQDEYEILINSENTKLTFYKEN